VAADRTKLAAYCPHDLVHDVDQRILDLRRAGIRVDRSKYVTVALQHALASDDSIRQLLVE
jgi:hypothetical protein